MTELIGDAHTTLKDMGDTYDKTQEDMEATLDSVAGLSSSRAEMLNKAKDDLQESRDATYDYLEDRVDGTGTAVEEAEGKLDEEATKLNEKIDGGYETMNTNADAIESSDTSTNSLLAEFDQKYDTMRSEFKNKKSLTNVKINALKQRIETDANTLKQSTATSASEIQGELTAKLNAAAFKSKALLAESMNTAQTHLDTQLDAVKAEAEELKTRFDGDMQDLTSDQVGDLGIIPTYQAKQKEVATQISHQDEDVANQQVKLEQAEQGMIAKIDKKDHEIEKYINAQGSRMQKKFAPFEESAQIIERDAAENIKKLPEEIKGAQDKMKQAKEDFSANEEELQKKVMDAKNYIGVKMHARAGEMDDVLGQVGLTMNEVLPALQKYAVQQGGKTLSQLEGIQAQLK